jgi:transcriptional regulator MraZ
VAHEGGAADGGDGNGSSRRAAFFRGVTHLALDTKGRLAIPSRHREALAAADGTPTLVLTVDPTSRCLLVYPREAWTRVESKLMELPAFDVQMRRLQRQIVGHAEEIDLDAAGRVLISPALRQYASLDHRVVLVGQGNKFELWDEAKWHDETARSVDFAGPLPPELAGFSL